MAFRFRVTSLRRWSEDDDQNAAMLASLRLGVRLSRLVAEAPPGSRIEVRSRANGDTLGIEIRASGPGLSAPRAGLPDEPAAMQHLATETRGLLSDFAGASGVEPLIGTSKAFNGGWLNILPRGRGKGLRPAGFVGLAEGRPGIWATPRASDPRELSELLIANPHVTLLQVVEAVDDETVEVAREELGKDMIVASYSGLTEAVGTPVRAFGALLADGPPWTLPLRLREHVRGWFDVLDLAEVEDEDLHAPVVMPEIVAGGLMRFPVTAETAFPGMAVEPVMIPVEEPAELAEGVRIGVATDLQDRSQPIRLGDSVRSRHVHVIGESGSGKSTLLTAATLEIAAAGEGLLLLDPHGATVDRVLAEMPSEHRDRVLLIRCGDTQNPVRLNPFAVDNPDLQDVVISDMLDTFQTMFDPNAQGIVGPRFQHIMRHALSTLVAVRGTSTSLLDVPRLLTDRELLRSVLDRVDDPNLQRFWEVEFLRNMSSDINEVIAWITSKFTTFAANRILERMLSTGRDSFDPVEVMRNGRIVLVDLDKGSAGVMGARVLGLLYLLRFWVAALEAEHPEPFSILVDEAASFSSVALPSILSEGRKFGLRAIVAHQYMGQLNESLADALAGSVATKIIFRLGPEDARQLSTATYPEFDALDLSSLPQFQAAARIASSGRPLRPFTLQVDHGRRVHPQPDAADAIHLIRKRSVAELVDPHREATPFSVEDIGGQPLDPRADNATGSASFLDQWLAEKRAASAARSGKSASASAPEDNSNDEVSRD